MIATIYRYKCIKVTLPTDPRHDRGSSSIFRSTLLWVSSVQLSSWLITHGHTVALIMVSLLWCLQEASPEERKKIVPRVVVVGGKAASAYYAAKKIVKL